jgi:hypothetical protein
MAACVALGVSGQAWATNYTFTQTIDPATLSHINGGRTLEGVIDIPDAALLPGDTYTDVITFSTPVFDNKSHVRTGFNFTDSFYQVDSLWKIVPGTSGINLVRQSLVGDAVATPIQKATMDPLEQMTLRVDYTGRIPKVVDVTTLKFSVTATPEPATWTMLILGFLGMGAVLRRRRAAMVAA